MASESRQVGDFVETPAMKIVAEWRAEQERAGTVSGRIGAYDVLSLIGRGGMGEVYLAHDTRLGRNVAVKVLQSSLTSNEDAVRRFEQEARAASSLNHPNIVTIYEIGDLPGRRFLAMEFVDGRSLASLVGAPMEIERLARVGVQLARALGVAHAAGIVHRDIKPENVILRTDGYVKVLDFGLARLAPVLPAIGVQSTPTSPSVILGTPRYMSPEQARGEVATSASDVFSFGVLLYELATGRHPFDSQTVLGTLHAIATAAVPDPIEWIPDMPPVLERLLFRMLEKHEAARPTAEEVERDLSRLGAAFMEPADAVLLAATRSPERRRTTLPSQRTSLVGRRSELVAVKGMLLDPSVRLLTLTGPGGTGKTRLGIRIADDLQHLFEGGVWFVNLAPLSDSALVASAIAWSLGVRESGDAPLLKTLADHVRGLGSTLLLMDNFEQVTDAAAVVKELLDACPELKVLATSRIVLRIYGEQEFPVPPLALPQEDAFASPGALMQCPSIALFVQRAAASRPDFVLTRTNAHAVVEICRRLDGLPLAIEMAAARMRTVSAALLLLHIERRSDLLGARVPDAPPRHQTMGDLIGWSYDLLPEDEQSLLRRLAVFERGCNREAAAALTGGDPCLLAPLVEKSLAIAVDGSAGESRVCLLETVRSFALERLREQGEEPGARNAHAEHVLQFVEEIAGRVREQDAAAYWTSRLAADEDNVRSALRWLVDRKDDRAGRLQMALAAIAAAGPSRDADDGRTPAGSAGSVDSVDSALRLLTAREREVAGLIARGLTSRKIAEALHISEKTVDCHADHIRTKLDLGSRVEIAAWAVAHGLHTPS
jgi:predicted ATPase/serine/threonine protein kinase/DNA-binding CsgD family transcriptional regulator